MNITKDALALLQETAQKAQHAVIHLPPNCREYLVQHCDKLEYREIPPDPRKHQVNSLADLIDYANLAVEEGHKSVIWHDQNGVVLVIDDDDRRDKVTFSLQPSPKFLILQKLEEEKPEFQQRDLIKLLRLELNIDSATIAIFRKLDWSSSTNASGTFDRGKESLGRSVESKVVGSQEIPDVIVIPIPLYTNLHEDQLYSIRCLVEFNAQAGRIQIVPQPDELQYTLHIHQMDIRKRLEAGLEGEKPAPVFYGQP
jgi:hypothetical protein